MLHDSDQTQMGDAFASARAEAGKLTPHEEAVKLLDECWQKHKPNITASLLEFSACLAKLSPIIVAVVRERWNEVVRRFAFRYNSEIAYEVRRNSGLRSAAARFEKSGGTLSTKKKLVTVRLRKIRDGEIVPASAALDNLNASFPMASERLRAQKRAYANRLRNDITLLKVEFDPNAGTITLLSKLPEHLRSFSGWTVAKAREWCDRQEAYATGKLAQIAAVRQWCDAVANDHDTLGEQLTPEIVARLINPSATISPSA